MVLEWVARLPVILEAGANGSLADITLSAWQMRIDGAQLYQGTIAWRGLSISICLVGAYQKLPFCLIQGNVSPEGKGNRTIAQEGRTHKQTYLSNYYSSQLVTHCESILITYTFLWEISGGKLVSLGDLNTSIR